MGEAVVDDPRTRRQRRAELREQLRREARARARAHVAVHGTLPDQAVLHLGPSNSGKTHDALNVLAQRVEAGAAACTQGLSGCLPSRCTSAYGLGWVRRKVGLRTGEEQINRDAPLLCCTAEAAPLNGDTLVVDEGHWIADRERGPAWTRLLVAGEFSSILATASTEAEALLRTALGDARRLDVVRHQRLAGLSPGGPWQCKDLPGGSAVVAFSRKAVHAVHRELLDHQRRTSALYGAMPPQVRREQIQRLVDGEIDVLVTTDVIGHGINLPLTAVAFAETTKYDGTSRRSLRVWEVA